METPEKQMPKYLMIEDGFARFCPAAEVSLQEAISLVGDAIEFCRADEIVKLLVDIRQLTGFPPPTIGQRFWFIREWAERSGGAVIIAMVARPEFIDPEKIGITIARNAGLLSDVFTSETEALDWLLISSSK
jgi:hypothetical protein